MTDDDLSAAIGYAPPAEQVAVAAEFDRRYPPAPGAAAVTRMQDDPAAERALSDDELAAAIGYASDPAVQARIAAELDRRHPPETPAPGAATVARMLADPAAERHLSDEELAEAIAHAADPAVQARIAAELDRRYPPETPADADVGQLLATHYALHAALSPMPPPEEWGANAAPDDDDGGGRARPDDDQDHDQDQDDEDPRPRLTRRQIRELYDEHVYTQYLAAEDALQGTLTSRAAELAGVSPITLWSGPAHIAYARASEELRGWWAEHPRLTLAEFTAQVTGQDSPAARRARYNDAQARQRY